MSRSRRSRSQDRGRQDQTELVWRTIDLHIHTPASADYQETGISYLDILRKAEARGADLIAFTDHNSVRGYANLWREIEDLELLEALERLTPTELRRLEEYRRLLSKVRVLPGFEFTATFGFHILAIFPEGTAIRMLEHLLLELNVPDTRIDQGTGEVGATTDVLNAYELLDRAGALVIPAHVNSTHGVAMQNLPFGGQTKIAFTQSSHIVALEATDLESTSRRSTAKFFNGSKPEYPRRMHIIQGSDAHRLNRDPNRESNLGVGDRMTEVQVSGASFTALAELFRSDHFNRVRPYRPAHDPYDFIRTARSEGETIVQAFHEKLPARRGRLSPIVRDIAALANENGGTVFVGLSANPKEDVTGVENAQEQVETILDDVARYVVPPLQIAVDLASTDNKQVLVITVPAGADKPYAVAPGTIYVRQEGETAVAVRDEIVQLVREGIAVSEGGLPELVTSPSVTPPVEAVESDKPRGSRRARGRRRSSSRHDSIEALEPGARPASLLDTHVATTNVPPAKPLAATHGDPDLEPSGAPPPDPAVPYPRTGVEIASWVERDGTTYYSMRDLRNLKVVQNVTRDSARRLWRYAITQREAQSLRPEHINWDGDRGFWKAYKQRGGEVRYNLVYRKGDDIHIFFGVTDEGMDERWRSLIPESVLRFVGSGADGSSGQPALTMDVLPATEVAPESGPPNDAPIQDAAASVAPTVAIEPPPDTQPVIEPETEPEPVAKPAARPRRRRKPVEEPDSVADPLAETPAAPTPAVEPEAAVKPAPRPRRRRKADPEAASEGSSNEPAT